jgi:hypothetical protein
LLGNAAPAGSVSATRSTASPHWSIRHELEPFASNGGEAFEIIDSLVAEIVAALRRDQRFAAMRLQELELLFADARADAERRLFNELRDHVHLDDVDYVNGDSE